MSDFGNARDELRNKREYSCVFKWTIRNISNIEKDAIIRSPWFEGKLHRCYVELKFAPETGIGLKLVLGSPGRKKSRQYECNITVHDMNEKLYEVHENNTEYPGFSFGINCTTLPNDIVLFCKLITTEMVPCSEVPSQTSEERLSSDLKSMLEHSIGTDVVLKVQGRDFKAHKAILSARSPVFKYMFLSNIFEASSEVVKIDDIDPNVFDVLVKYLYTGILYNDFSDIVYSLYYASDKYQLLELRAICGNEMLAQLNCQNAMEILRLADEHSDDYLFENVSHFIGFHLDEPKFTEEWLCFLSNHFALMERIMNLYATKSDLREYEFKYNMTV